MWNDIQTYEGYLGIQEVLRNGHEAFKDRALRRAGAVRADPGAGRTRPTSGAEAYFDRLEARLEASPFIASARFTYADIVGYVYLGFAVRVTRPRPGREQARAQALERRPSRQLGPRSKRPADATRSAQRGVSRRHGRINGSALVCRDERLDAIVALERARVQCALRLVVVDDGAPRRAAARECRTARRETSRGAPRRRARRRRRRRAAAPSLAAGDTGRARRSARRRATPARAPRAHARAARAHARRSTTCRRCVRRMRSSPFARVAHAVAARSSSLGAAPKARCGNLPSPTRSRVVIGQYKLGACGSTAISRARARGVSESSAAPDQVTVPECGTRPASALSKLVLPAPFGPTSATSSARPSSTLTGCNATRVPYATPISRAASVIADLGSCAARGPCAHDEV